MLLFSLAFSLCATAVELDWEKFLARNDMVWNKLPDHWNNGPFIGNGSLGAIFWQNQQGALHFEVSRSDLYDNRRLEGYGPLFARCRMPNGHYELSFGEGKPTGEMRLDLWNAEARGRVTLGKDSWDVRCFTHANGDVIVLEVTGDGAAPQLTWHPDPSKPTRTRSGVPPDLKAYPPQTKGEVDGVTLSVQAVMNGGGRVFGGQVDHRAGGQFAHLQQIRPACNLCGQLQGQHGFTGTTGRHQRPDRTGHHVGQNVVQRWRRCCERLQNIDRLMGSH